MKKRILFSHILKNEKGQVAIFVALIFQVLFVFFAMIVNIGLLVHHKINLQNSVDLAAYYGAMKQAEMLNAISHVNYQIRQSFKLLTFRYQQFGSAGTTASGRHPYSGGPTGQITRTDDVPLPFDTSFCVPYSPVDLVNNNRESYCKEISELKVPLPAVPSLGAMTQWTGFQTSIIQLQENIVKKSQEYCRYSMASNWLQLAKFIAAYKSDIRNRKKLLLGLANELSQDSPKDVQGESIREGAYRTLIKNLTAQNSDGLKGVYGNSGTGSGNQEHNFKFINSFSQGSCKGNPTEASPPGWLKEIFIFPVYAVFDGTCGANDSIRFAATYFNVSATPTISPNIQLAMPDLVSFAQQLAQLDSEYPSSDPQQLLFRSSIGFEKSPWCVGYVGVHATTTPKIPFSPLGAVTLKATSYAKPFGGRVGPWYGTTWQSGAQKSDDSKRTDALLPMRVEPQIQITGFDPGELKQQHRIFPNHSRYLGDQLGVISELTIGQFAKAIHQKLGNVKLAWYNHIFDQDFDNKSAAGDPLAWDKDLNKTVPLRDLEIAAVAPDQFDASTYSIDPDFYNNYLLKIQKGYGSKFNFLLRGDLGSRMQGSDAEKRFSIRNQIENLKDTQKEMIDWTSQLTYYLNEFAQVLTSWQQRTPDSYVLDDTRFGKCDQDMEVKQTGDEKTFTMGSCKVGGRTGYSVKLVDGSFLKNSVNGTETSYELGGKGQSGRIENPPPDVNLWPN